MTSTPRCTAAVVVVLAMLAGCTAPEPAEQSPEPAEPTSMPGEVVTALDGEGLRFVDAATGTTRPLAFGTPFDAAVEAVARVEGAAPVREANDECGAGPLVFATWPDGLRLHGADGRFVGWSVGEGAPYTTMGGVGPGVSLAEVESVVVVNAFDSTLGREFAAGGLYGLLDGPGDDAVVTDLWAGTSCVFR